MLGITGLLCPVIAWALLSERPDINCTSALSLHVGSDSSQATFFKSECVLNKPSASGWNTDNTVVSLMDMTISEATLSLTDVVERQRCTFKHDVDDPFLFFSGGTIVDALKNFGLNVPTYKRQCTALGTEHTCTCSGTVHQVCCSDRQQTMICRPPRSACSRLRNACWRNHWILPKANFRWNVSQTHRNTDMLPWRSLPVQESNRVWVFHPEWNELDIGLGKVLLLQAIHCTLTIFLCTLWDFLLSIHIRKTCLRKNEAEDGVKVMADLLPPMLSHKSQTWWEISEISNICWTTYWGDAFDALACVRWIIWWRGQQGPKKGRCLCSEVVLGISFLHPLVQVNPKERTGDLYG